MDEIDADHRTKNPFEKIILCSLLTINSFNLSVYLSVCLCIHPSAFYPYIFVFLSVIAPVSLSISVSLPLAFSSSPLFFVLNSPCKPYMFSFSSLLSFLLFLSFSSFCLCLCLRLSFLSSICLLLHFVILSCFPYPPSSPSHISILHSSLYHYFRHQCLFVKKSICRY